ncbi:MAG: PilT/PilU family type 4a pilus ATPase [Myxococcales bacterium]|nr:PilT/PilU family type 4a pilus ATPase [Myxococcales bacterium]
MTESDRDAALLGRIAVKNRFITMEQLAEATRRRGRKGQKLGAVLVELGMITELQLGKILALQKRYLQQRAQEPTPPRVLERVKVPTPRDWVAQEDELARQPVFPSPTPEAPPTTEPQAMVPIEPPRMERPRGAITDPATPAARRSEAPPMVEPPPFDDWQSGDDEWAPDATEDALDVDLDHADFDVAGDDIEPLRPSQGRITPDPRPAPQPLPKAVPRAVSRSPTLPPEPLPEPAPPPAPAAERQVQPVASEEWEREGLPNLEPRPFVLPTPSARVHDLHRFLEAAVRSGASDVHVHAGAPVKMRQFGRLRDISDSPLSADATQRVLLEMLTSYQADVLSELGEVDFAYPIPGIGRFRCNVYRHHRGFNGVFHIVPTAPPTLESLGLPTSLARLTNFAQGLVLLTGPAGCGKTSTLAAIVDIINTERSEHILTIEDPIEYVHESRRCVVNQRQVGRHTSSFARALRGALREDPDIICIGELRDIETISLALSAAETGHLVLATLHTGSSIGTINRIVGAYPPAQQPQVRSMLSESLRAVISQRLVPRADGRGVVPALEILYVNKAIGALIREGRAFQIRSALQTGKAQGMQLLSMALDDLVKAGTVAAADANRFRPEGVEGSP